MNHQVRAESLRRREAACESSAKETTSLKFRDCYRLLAKQYGMLAQMEEAYATGSERLAAQRKPSH